MDKGSNLFPNGCFKLDIVSQDKTFFRRLFEQVSVRQKATGSTFVFFKIRISSIFLTKSECFEVYRFF